MLEAESTPGPYYDRKDFMSMKNPLIPVAIEPVTFRFVVQHLNHCATAVPALFSTYKQKSDSILYNFASLTYVHFHLVQLNVTAGGSN